MSASIARELHRKFFDVTFCSLFTQVCTSLVTMNTEYKISLTKLENVPITDNQCCINLTTSKSGTPIPWYFPIVLFVYLFSIWYIDTRIRDAYPIQISIVTSLHLVCYVSISASATEHSGSSSKYTHLKFMRRHRLVYLVQSLILILILSFAGFLIYLAVVSGV